MTTFDDVLTTLLRRSPGEPLVTFYDHSTSERVELSVVTYANWVAKASSLLVEEYDVERGMRIRVDLPAHWLGTVFLGAAWNVGLTVVWDDTCNVVVCGPASLDTWAERAEEIPVLACSLLPMGVRFREALPPSVHDVGVEIWSQPDAFVAWDPATADDLAWVDGERRATQGEMWGTAAAGSLLTDGGRLLTVANPTSPSGVATFIEPLARGGSMVLVAQADPERLELTAEQEQVTARLS